MKNKLNDNSGITLITLSILIIVLMILAGMTIYNVTQAVNSAKMSAFTTELKIMQTQVNLLNEKMRNNEKITINGVDYQGKGGEGKAGIQEIGSEISSEKQEQADKVFDALKISTEDRKKYRYYDEELIKNGLGVQGVGQELLVDIENREVISYKGLECKGNTYYNLASLPDGLYNVAHENNSAEPVFTLNSKQISPIGEWQMEVSNIEYDGYIEKWNVKYKKEGQENWTTSENMKINVNESGSYIVKIENGDVSSQEQEINIDYNVVPELTDEMKAIVYDDEGNAQEVENPEKDDWYSYEVTEDDDMADGGTTNGGNSRWANMMLNDNYYVWVPRYAYSVSEKEKYTQTSGEKTDKIEVEFIETSITNENVEEKVGENYKIPDAFSTEDGELAGIWVAKYQISGSIEEPKIIPNSKEDIFVEISDDDITKVKENLKTDNTQIDVLNEKGTEAVNILAQSQYGRNGTEITKDAEEGQITEDMGSEELKTTTGNIYGIYYPNENGVRVYLYA